MISFTNISEVKENKVLARTIYTANSKILLTKGVKLTQKYINKIKELGIENIYIEDEDISRRDYFSEKLVPQKFKEAAKFIAKNYLNKIMLPKEDLIDKKKMINLIEEIIELISDNSNLFNQIKNIRKIDDELLFHSTEVTILALLMGKKLNYSQERLRELGIGAFLHDIGKVKVPAKILNKPGKLTEKEFKEIKKHTTYGYQILKEYQEIPDASAKIVYQHHEKCDGLGYPEGIKGRYISKYAKIVAIADIYNSMVIDRVYRSGLEENKVINYLYTLCTKNKLDQKLMKTFLEIVTPYPIGSMVELNIGCKAVVTRINKVNKLRPIVTITDLKKSTEPLEINLIENSNISITGVVR